MPAPTRPPAASFGDLPHCLQRLIRAMQVLDFGTIEGLVVRDGLPTFDPEPVVSCDRRCGASNGARAEAALDDFQLKDEVLELIQQLAEFGSGVVTRIEVKHGLPFRVVYPLPFPA